MTCQGIKPRASGTLVRHSTTEPMNHLAKSCQILVHKHRKIIHKNWNSLFGQMKRICCVMGSSSFNQRGYACSHEWSFYVYAWEFGLTLPGDSLAQWSSVGLVFRRPWQIMAFLWIYLFVLVFFVVCSSILFSVFSLYGSWPLPQHLLLIVLPSCTSFRPLLIAILFYFFIYWLKTECKKFNSFCCFCFYFILLFFYN